jgi:ligand-binding sensor domain-containing protein
LGVWDNWPDRVKAILSSRAGPLWFGTDDSGVFCFDGLHITAFTIDDGLASNVVLALLEDCQGRVWCGTQEGVSRYDGKTWETFTVADGLASNAVRALWEDRQGRIWIGTHKDGISYYDGRNWETFTTADGLASNIVHTLFEDQKGHLWCSSGNIIFVQEGAGLSRYDGQNWEIFTTSDGLPSNTVQAIIEDRQGILWVGTDKGASRFDGTHFAPVDALLSEPILTIAEDGQGDLWFGTQLKGVYRFDGTLWMSYTFVDGLVNDQVYAVEKDQQGNMWFGTMTGVSRYERAAFTHFTTENGLALNGVVSILEDQKGTLWFGTFRGVSRYDGASWTSVEALANWNVWSIVEDRQGQLWFGDAYTKGVMLYDKNQYIPLTATDGLGDNSAWCLFEDSQGQLWCGSRTRGGLSRFDGESWIVFTTEEGLASNQIKAIIEDRQGHIWVGTHDEGLSRYDGLEFTSFTIADGLAFNSVLALLEDRQGHIWIGTQGGGVSRFDGKSFQNFTVTEGLGHNKVTSIMQDSRGHLWFGTFGGGVSCYDGQVFQTLTRQDGLVFDVVQALLEDRHGHIWIATEGGITCYTPSLLSPQVQLQAAIADQEYPLDKPLCIVSSQKRVTFMFKARSWTTPSKRMAYIYQLEGYDADWKPIYSDRVTYQDLPEGDYTFQVKAVDRDLNYSEPAQVQVTIEPDPLLESLTAALGQGGPHGEFVGRSASLRKVQQQLRQIAPTDLKVLILGETGTGKGLAARTLHQLSPRRAAPFILVTCGAIPQDLVESELFGHEKGAFTGAVGRRLGKVELAKGGTLFLDEIGDLPLAEQVKLLRLLEEGTFERVGGSEVLNAEVRVVAATNRDMLKMVEGGTFREDLYFRLQGFEVQLPPLRERREDIRLLALYFIGPQAAHLDKQVTG